MRLYVHIWSSRLATISSGDLNI